MFSQWSTYFLPLHHLFKPPLDSSWTQVVYLSKRETSRRIVLWVQYRLIVYYEESLQSLVGGNVIFLMWRQWRCPCQIMLTDTVWHGSRIRESISFFFSRTHTSSEGLLTPHSPDTLVFFGKKIKKPLHALWRLDVWRTFKSDTIVMDEQNASSQAGKTMQHSMYSL